MDNIGDKYSSFTKINLEVQIVISGNDRQVIISDMSYCFVQKINFTYFINM